ncbi:hypothetical protein D3C83_60100 [compost metagenome]
MPEILTSGLNGKTKRTQSLHSPGFIVSFVPETSIASDCRSSATVKVIGILT